MPELVKNFSIFKSLNQIACSNNMHSNEIFKEYSHLNMTLLDAFYGADDSFDFEV